MTKELKVKGLSVVKAALIRTGKTTNDRMLAAVDRASNVIVEEARLNAPVDEGDLERAIKVLDRAKFGGTRLHIVVGIDPSELGEGYKKRGERYDIRMHEGVYKLGEKSRRKANYLGGNGGLIGRVGPKFLERALDKVTPELEAELQQIRREIKLK